MNLFSLLHFFYSIFLLYIFYIKKNSLIINFEMKVKGISKSFFIDFIFIQVILHVQIIHDSFYVDEMNALFMPIIIIIIKPIDFPQNLVQFSRIPTPYLRNTPPHRSAILGNLRLSPAIFGRESPLTSRRPQLPSAGHLWR